MTTLTCPYCERRCALAQDGVGFCGMYTAQGDAVVERWPHRYSSIQIAHIETVPFFHFQPGSRTLILGGAGCNFDCHYCSNAHVARSDPNDLLIYSLEPERVVKFANDYGCHNIAFAVNEPTVALPTLFAVAEAAHDAGLPIGALTNGYTQPETTERMGHAFDFLNVSLKGLRGSFFAEHVGLPAGEDGASPSAIVLRNIAALRALTHVEVSTPIVQGVNDTEVPAMAAALGAIDRRIPWHVFRLLPEYKMADYERPSIDAVVAALEDARGALDYIYFGNFVGSQWVSTNCPGCGALAIERINLSGCSSKALSYHLDAAQRCDRCGADLGIAGPAVTWHSKDEPAWTLA